jgi:hypothetical protein
MLISATPISLWVLYLNLNPTRSDSGNIQMKVSKIISKLELRKSYTLFPDEDTLSKDTKLAESLSFVTRGTAMGNGRHAVIIQRRFPIQRNPTGSKMTRNFTQLPFFFSQTSCWMGIWDMLDSSLLSNRF